MKALGRKPRLLFMMSLTISFFVIELVVGSITNSMALIADSFHMLSDVVAIFISFLAIKISTKKWSRNTFGWARAEVVGALVNSAFLIALCFSIFVESCQRFMKVETIENPQLILVVGSIGLLFNIIGLFLFHDHGHSHGNSHGHSHGNSHGHSHGNSHGHSHGHDNGGVAAGHSHNHDHVHSQRPDERTDHLLHSPQHVFTNQPQSFPSDVDENQNACENRPTKMIHIKENATESSSEGKGKKASKSSEQLNMRGVFLHILADALGSVVVVVSALVIWLTNWEYKMYVDPVLSIMMVCLIFWSTWPLLKESCLILLQNVPPHIKTDEIRHKLIQEVEGPLSIHELHIWQLAGDRIVATVHIRCRNVADFMKVGEKVKEFFHKEGIHSTTIQLEFNQTPLEEESAFADAISDCMLKCPETTNNKRNCDASTCCDSLKPSVQKRRNGNNGVLASIQPVDNGNIRPVEITNYNNDAAMSAVNSNQGAVFYINI